jgi:aspartate/methionine/tyrosine aminotransferase
MVHLAKRALSLESSPTLAAAAKAKAMMAKGIDVINLSVGEPDFVTPKNIQYAAIESITSGRASYYTTTAGLPILKQAIHSYYAPLYKYSFGEENIVVTDGAKFALYALFQVLLDYQEEVLIPAPYWVSYSEQVKLAYGKPIFIATSEENHFKATVEDFESARKDNTRAIILNSPSNPAGTIYSKEELLAIGNWAVEHNILIVSDDIYGPLTYNGNEFTPIASLSQEIFNQTIIINGLSKAFAMTGWRIGFLIANSVIIDAVTKVISQSTSNATTVSQYAAIEALTGAQDSVEMMRATFEARLNEIYPKLMSLPGFKGEKPQGAFYLFPNIKETLELTGYEDTTSFVEDLLEEEHVALIAGVGFGAPYNIRMSYAADLASLHEAIIRMERFIHKKMKK